MSPALVELSWCGRDLLDTEERWLVSGTAASRAGAEADSLGFSRFVRDFSSV